MTDYQPNSHKSKTEGFAVPKKKVEKVAKGKTKKKSEIAKFADVFLQEDVSSVKSYILSDVVIPALKKAISDVVTNGIDMLLYGESGSAKKTTPASKVSYRSYYERPNDRYSKSQSSIKRYNYDEVVLESRGEAEEVLSRMEDLIATYNVVSVADFYDLVDVSCNYTDNNYGWTDIRNASIQRTRDGYIIRLPRPMPID